MLAAPPATGKAGADIGKGAAAAHSSFTATTSMIRISEATTMPPLKISGRLIGGPF
ncbi:hypothetical protein [Sphingobium scionense]|uniref:Uncharacterized protein n=1 Tax=Sphingobium scionense TaxID=1404341 RepID=A0A7W6LTF3_9SPHN|nr:hypothetical protein [Sphingobium scionense]MBB4149107.1 hypothetical protein [Sphingobium scionense]